MLDTINLAEKLGVTIINMHMPKGVHFTMPNKKIYLFDKYKNHFLAKVSNFKNIVEKNIENKNIKICIENCEFFKDFQLEAIDRLLGSSCLYLTYDIGHATCNQEFMDSFYSTHEKKLIHMHCHDARQDNKGNWIDHLPLGADSLNIEHYLKLAKKLGISIVFETKTALGLAQSVIGNKKFNIED